MSEVLIRSATIEDVPVILEFIKQLAEYEKLLNHLAKLAKSRNCGRLEWSVLNWNEPAINFYKRLGAIPMDEWTVFRVTGDALERLAIPLPC